MSFKEIFCQDKAVSVLQRAYAANKIPHVYIFAGAEGIGKFKTAREWAKLLVCEKPVRQEQFADSCGGCQSCRMFEADAHPDFNHVHKELVEFTRDNKGRKTPVEFPIDVVREFVIEKVSTRPALSQSKVFILSEAEKLNVQSQNCLLKVIEEPPAYCYIILLCTRLEKLLATTKSRCQIIRFGPIEQDRIVSVLMDSGLKEEKARYFARLAQGSLGQACQWAQLELADANLYRIKKNLVDCISSCEYGDALNLAQSFLQESKKISTVWSKLDQTTSKSDINRRALKTLVQIIIAALHDAMKLNVTGDKNLINFDQQEQIRKLAARFSPEQSAEKITGCCRTMRWIESAVNEKLIFEELLLNLAVSDKIRV